MTWCWSLPQVRSASQKPTRPTSAVPAISRSGKFSQGGNLSPRKWRPFSTRKCGATSGFSEQAGLAFCRHHPNSMRRRGWSLTSEIKARTRRAIGGRGLHRQGASGVLPQVPARGFSNMACTTCANDPKDRKKTATSRLGKSFCSAKSNPHRCWLLADGKTDLINKFISNRTGRALDAFLQVKDGKVGFEFSTCFGKEKNRLQKGGNAPAVKLSFEGADHTGSPVRCGGRVFRANVTSARVLRRMRALQIQNE